jgi:hypothetical protein
VERPHVGAFVVVARAHLQPVAAGKWPGCIEMDHARPQPTRTKIGSKKNGEEARKEQAKFGPHVCDVMRTQVSAPC